MLRATVILLFCALTGSGISPITEIVQIRLQGTADGSDLRGEGFAALTEHVLTWSGETSSLQTPEFGALLATPEEFRGQLFEVSGVVELSSQLDAEWEGITELFVREPLGGLVGLYIVGEPLQSLGSTVRAPAIFYKTMDIEGGDHQIRRYPMFVTSSAVLLGQANLPTMQRYVLLVPILVLVFGMVFVFARSKHKRKPRKRERIASSDVIEAANETATELPSKASDALAVMYEDSERME